MTETVPREWVELHGVERPVSIDTDKVQWLMLSEEQLEEVVRLTLDVKSETNKDEVIVGPGIRR